MAKATTNKEIKTASVLAFERKLECSDAVFEQSLGLDGDNTPVVVREKSVRGTISNRLKANIANDEEKLKSEVEKANLQTVEIASLDSDKDTLHVKWSCKVIPFDGTPAVCNNSAYQTKLEQSLHQYIKTTGFGELAHRYAYNIINGRWLWRNRSVAEHISIKVSEIIEHDQSQTTKSYKLIAEFNALDYSLKSFDDVSESENKIANILVRGMQGDVNSGLHIEAIVDFGMGGVEVFPSQNYLEEKPKGFSRSLYQLNPIRPERQAKDNQFLGQAAIRDQKIGNALRTIDTWYDKFLENDSKPIPVEPNGASLDAQDFFRVDKKKKDSAFDILKEIRSLDPNSDKGMFLIACLVRGGVYSEGE